MKHFALLISILSITFSCANQKKNCVKSKEDSAKVSMQIPVNKSDFSPGTLALNIKIIKIIKTDKHYQVKAQVNKTLGFGAGITHNYSIGEKISFESNRDLNLTPDTDYSFLFKETHTMGNNKTGLKLIRVIK